MVVVGRTGSGKSYVSLYIAEKLDPNFSIDRVCFNVESFIKLVDSGLPPGSVVVLEEAGVLADSRTFYSEVNRAIVYTTETMRSSRLIFICNLPTFDALDKRVRSLIHSLVMTQTIDKGVNKCICKWFKVNIDSLSGMLYRQHFKHEDKTLTRVKMALPSLKLRRQYEYKKGEFRKELSNMLLKQLNTNTEIQKRQAPFDTKAAVGYINENTKQFTREYQGHTRVDVSLIQAHFGIGERRAKVVRALAEKVLDMN